MNVNQDQARNVANRRVAKGKDSTSFVECFVGDNSGSGAYERNACIELHFGADIFLACDEF